MKILRIDEFFWDKIPENQRKVFLRVDFNVPMERGTITDDFRIRQAIPTIRYLLEKKCLLILGAHFGRPKAGDPNNKRFTLLPVAEKLAELLDHEVIFSEEIYGDGVRKLVSDGRGGKTIILLENLRLDPREEQNDAEFAEHLFEYADIFVNDAFGASHRAHASIEGITHFAKLKGMGFLLAKEWEALNQVLHHPKQPQMAVLGGAKISDKIQVIKNIMRQCKTIFVGGRMGNTFLAAQGYDLGGSSIEEDALPLARRLLADARSQEIEIVFPIDGRAASSIEAKEAKVVKILKDEPLSKGISLFDIGPETLDLWSHKLRNAKSVIWNGPLGVFENPTFAQGTLGLVDFFVAERKNIQMITGGGETVSAITQRGALESLYHVSTGGGAMLEFLEGKELPGFESIKYKDREIEALGSADA